MGKNCVVLGDKYDITLWGFKCQLRDRRNGEITEGYIVVTGNEEYDLEPAYREIKSKYGDMGYTVHKCIYDATKVWNYDAIEIFESAPVEKGGKKHNCGMFGSAKGNDLDELLKGGDAIVGKKLSAAAAQAGYANQAQNR